MHVLILPSWYSWKNRPILGSFFAEQAYGLHRAGHKVGVIAPIRIYLPRLKDVLEQRPGVTTLEDDHGVATYRHYGWKWLPFIPYGEAFLYRRIGLRLFERYVAEQGRPDLVHAHSALYGGVLATAIRERYHLPFVLTEHSSAFALSHLFAWQNKLAHRAFAEASARVVVSPELGGQLEKKFGQTFMPWTYIPNTVSSRFIPGSASEAASKKFVFLNLGHLETWKGHVDLLQAFAARFKGNQSIELRIGGEGSQLRFLVSEARRLGIGEQVHFLGSLSREQVVAEMQASNVFVLPSHYETFGVVLVEALACGKPVIATACGGPDHIVQPSDGLLVPPQNPLALGNAMKRIKERITDYDPQFIREDCLARFGEQRVVAELSALYQAVVSKELAA